MVHFRKYILSLLPVITFLFCCSLGCGKKESDTQPETQHAASIRFEGEVPAVHKKTMADEEIERNKRLLEANPNDAVAYYNLGLLYDEKGMLDESLAAYKKASELNPSMVEALVGQGNILNKKGKSDEAISFFIHGESASGCALAVAMSRSRKRIIAAAVRFSAR